MNLQNLPPITRRKKRRLGQGHGSGRGKTAGRGTKGQKARGKIPLSFEGGALPLIKRLPFLRGKGRNPSFRVRPALLNVRDLNNLSKNSTVTLETLVEKNIIDKKALKTGVKILGQGDLNIALKIKVPTSKSAADKVIKAGGTIEL